MALLEENPGPWQEHRFEDLELHVRVRSVYEGYTMEYEVRPLCRVDHGDGPAFEFGTVGDSSRSTPDVESGIVSIKGLIKYDGCSDNWFEENLHACSRQEMVRLGELFTRLFDLAKALITGDASPSEGLWHDPEALS